MTSSRELTDLSNDETDDADDDDEDPFDIKSAISATQGNPEETKKKGPHIALYGQSVVWVPIRSHKSPLIRSCEIEMPVQQTSGLRG
ncbi:hypothetical protein CYMTET_35308 [Cymbomonas tetramitiformis]|uniref:Uncharacterized protein n=1 Tax=Cymbomonas tetramitiformis TaxID=36881 RepID=A0AAE0F9G9_9CHLO|nr:hypothetical protein CYMTET_35308 [Cymbomonas tetramitiformis]